MDDDYGAADESLADADLVTAETRWYRRPRNVVIGAALTVVAIGGGVAIYETSTGQRQPPAAMQPLPVVIATWFPGAVQEAYNLLSQGYTALDAVELGCTYCEDQRCDGTVGWGGSPDTNGETTLDAFIMDGETHVAGAVTSLRRVRHAISAARKVMAYTQHTLLAGDGATNFSLQMGLPESDLHSQESVWSQGNWTANSACQPNYWWDLPGWNTSCAPLSESPVPTPTYTPAYTPLPGAEAARLASARLEAADREARPGSMVSRRQSSRFEHDTIGMCVLDFAGRMAAGGSSNGATHKVPGRSSDIALPGAGSYVDKDGGCAGATGDGDITMRFLPAYQAVEFMRGGMGPQAACEAATRRIMAYYGKNFHLGLICMDRYGRVGAAGQGWTWAYAVASGDNATAVVVNVKPLDA